MLTFFIKILFQAANCNIKNFHLIISALICSSLQGWSQTNIIDIQEHAGRINSVCFDPHDQLILSSSGDKSWNLWDIKNNMLIHKSSAHYDIVNTATFHPNNNIIASGSDDTSIEIYNFKKDSVVTTLNDHLESVNTIRYSKDGSIMASGSWDKSIIIWDTKDYAKISTLSGHKNSVYSIRFSNDNKFLISASRDKTIIIWDLAKMTPHKIIEGHKGWIRSVDIHPLDKTIASVDDEHAINIFSFPDGKLIRTISKHTSPIRVVKYSSKGDILATGDMSDNIFFWDTQTWEFIGAVKAHEGGVKSLDFSSNDELLVSGGFDSHVKVWELTSLFRVKDCFDDKLPSDLRVCAPKDEFETSDQYNQRINAQAKNIELSKSICKDEFLLYRNTKIQKSETDTILPISNISKYMADAEIFSIKLGEEWYKVRIPLHDAKTFKNHYKELRVNVKKRLKLNLYEYEFYNMYVTHPISKIKYYFGKQILDEEIEIADQRGASQLNHTKANTSAKGKNYALLFANNKYDNWTYLNNPINDVRTLENELVSNYNFEAKVVINASTMEIMNALREYAKKDYEQSDQLLIFFAGHGHYDEVFKEGYVVGNNTLLPEQDQGKTSFISHSVLRTIINNIPNEHILLLLDVCFGGTFDQEIAKASIAGRGGDLYKKMTANEFIAKKKDLKTRVYITSGGKEYVPDGKPGNHSPFVRRILESLRTYGGSDKILTMNEIFVNLQMVNPMPYVGEFGDNMPGSEFLFIPVK